MLDAIEVDSIRYLEVVDSKRPVIRGDQADYLAREMLGGFVTWPITNSAISMMRQMPSLWTLVSTCKKDTEAIKKAGMQVKKVAPSVSDVIAAASRLSVLTRQSMAISDLKDVDQQIQAATQIALLGETKEAVDIVLAGFPTGRTFALQSAMLGLRIKTALSIADEIDPHTVPEVGGLLLSGHLVAFASRGPGGVVAVSKAMGLSSFYVERIAMESARYTRRVDFVKSSVALSSIMDRIKKGENPSIVLRSTLIAVLTSVEAT
jgi:hypothetical protein